MLPKFSLQSSADVIICHNSVVCPSFARIFCKELWSHIFHRRLASSVPISFTCQVCQQNLKAISWNKFFSLTCSRAFIKVWKKNIYSHNHCYYKWKPQRMFTARQLLWDHILLCYIFLNILVWTFLCWQMQLVSFTSQVSCRLKLQQNDRLFARGTMFDLYWLCWPSCSIWMSRQIYVQHISNVLPGAAGAEWTS